MFGEVGMNIIRIGQKFIKKHQRCIMYKFSAENFINGVYSVSSSSSVGSPPFTSLYFVYGV